MRKIYLLLIVCLFYNYSKAQDSLLFKIKYLPNHSYESTIAMDMNMEMNVAGDKKEMDAIKEKGIKLPMIMTSVTNMGLNIKTGSVVAENSFPLTMTYTNVSSKKTLNGEEMAGVKNPMIGQTIYGGCTTAGKIHLDSISGKAMDENLKTTLATVINSMVNQLKFPEKPLKIGDTFSQDVPVSFPVSGINMQFTIKIVYKLVSIENDSANFDLNQSMVFNMSTQKDGITMTGSGTGKGNGKLIYSISQNFSTLMDSKFDFDYKMGIKDMTMTGKATMSSVHQTKINSTVN